MALNEERIQEMLDSQLEALASEKNIETFLDDLGRFHHYSARNVALLRAQCPQLSRLAGFNAWKEAGRKVKKGEKALTILFPKMVEKENDKGEKEKVAVSFYPRACLFDISQTEGDEMAFEGICPQSALNRLGAHIVLEDGDSDEVVLIKTLNRHLNNMTSFERSAIVYTVCSTMGIKTPLEELVIQSSSVEDAKVNVLFTLGEIQRSANEILGWIEEEVV